MFARCLITGVGYSASQQAKRWPSPFLAAKFHGPGEERGSSGQDMKVCGSSGLAVFIPEDSHPGRARSTTRECPETGRAGICASTGPLTPEQPLWDRNGHTADPARRCRSERSEKPEPESQLHCHPAGHVAGSSEVGVTSATT